MIIRYELIVRLDIDALQGGVGSREHDMTTLELTREELLKMNSTDLCDLMQSMQMFGFYRSPRHGDFRLLPKSAICIKEGAEVESGAPHQDCDCYDR